MTKGVSLEPWAGNASPRIAETASGMLNSIGLQNPGVEAFVAKDLAWLARRTDTPVIVNVRGHTRRGVRAVVPSGSMARPASPPSRSTSRAPTSMPAAWRSAPTARPPPRSLRAVPRGHGQAADRQAEPQRHRHRRDRAAVEAAGADAVSLINTLLGMSIDVETPPSEARRVVGGLSGPAIKPVALRMVWQVANAVAVPWSAWAAS